MSPSSPLSVIEHVPAGGPGGDPMIVLVHGSLDRGGSFTRVLRRLDDLHTVAFDRRGYNRSRDALPINTTLDGQIDDLLEVIDGRAAVVVGHSYGGDVALGAALRQSGPSPIVSVVAYEPPMPWLGFWRSSREPVSGSASPDAVDPEDQSPAAAAERFFRRMVGDAAWDRLPAAARAGRRADGPALDAELRALRLAEAPFDVGSLTIPATYGVGSRSVDRYRQTAEWLVEHTPGAELIEIAGASHGAHLTHPDAFAGLIRSALARAARPARTSR
jgi:pimeloyl-ACP methyl ester carboxylesterase